MKYEVSKPGIFLHPTSDLRLPFFGRKGKGGEIISQFEIERFFEGKNDGEASGRALV
jgi:hypothetical protein